MPGNDRLTDKWENLIPVDCDYYPECDNSILWSDITQELAETLNNKNQGAEIFLSEKKETWLCYIDYSKAYDRVPHMALLHKLRSVGIWGKLLNMIKGMYDAPKIAVRVGNEVSNPTEYLCGVRQACPASPILFYIHINDIFKGVRGLQVPGLTSRIPGLLFADDAVLFAESSADLHAALDTITEWSDTWEMAVKASKCGIMTISGEMTTDMTPQGQKVDSTDQYTYLGYIMNSKWDVSGTINNNKNKVSKAIYAAYSFLRRSDVLTALKIKFINSVLMPIGCYGGETFGMSIARCKPIQSEIDKVIRMVANVGKSAAMERIRDELGISSVFMRTSTARERAYHKW
ncbi:RNA-directed DNA polymerase from mobile element jockey [Smittium culicis]|uniref:RNA-directed DNA polymerase from mobile element jockey n=1 Tax=Smittium culicis TaxID=133412 RepID=A0A1R1YFS2_9FUNG|nr:RNA-directed DNA polymerase from mobile element jockey [Smittium culicis]